jgi:FKBP-type peptidyl-prolyl cis-trans isomerase SlyD
VRISLSLLVSLISAIVLISPAGIAAAEKSRDERVVKAGLLVSIDFTLKGTDGKVIETTKGQGPAQYIHGKQMLPTGLERALTGMKVGEQKNVTLKPEDAYGKVDPKATKEIAREKVPPNGLKVGAVLTHQNPDGSLAPMTVRQIKEKTVVMDMNHPMAGKTLLFDVKVVDLQPAPPPSARPATPAAPSKPAQPAKPAAPATK